jgi:hypothetical protein
LNNLTRLDDESWPSFINEGRAVVVFTRSDCKACTEILESLDTIFSAQKVLDGNSRYVEKTSGDEKSDSMDYLRPRKVNGVEVQFAEARLDEPGLSAVKRQEKWILAEVDILPFWVLFTDGKRRCVHRGADSERLSRWLKEALD